MSDTPIYDEVVRDMAAYWEYPQRWALGLGHSVEDVNPSIVAARTVPLHWFLSLTQRGLTTRTTRV